MPLGARLAVITHNMGGCFIESVKNAQLLMSPQEARDALKSILEFQVQIKGHNQRENEEKLQGWQNWTNGKLTTNLTKNDQQPVLMMMIAFITIKSSLVPLIEGLCAEIYFRFEISVVCSHLLLFFFVKEKIC